MTLKRALTRWLVLQRVGKKTSTRHYYWELIKSVRRAMMPFLERDVESLEVEDLLCFVRVAGHYCDSRWNGMLSILHATVPASLFLKRRKVVMRAKRMPNQQEFTRLLEE